MFTPTLHRTGVLVVALCTTLCGVADVAVAAPFTNGSFEAPNIATFTSHGVGTGPAPWVATVNGILHSDGVGYFGPASSGIQYMELNVPAGPGAMTQTFDVLPNRSYRIDFDLSGLADGTADLFNVDLTATGSPTTSFPFNTGAAASTTIPAYVTNSYYFTTIPAQISVTLTVASTLASSSGAFFGPVVDNFQLVDLGSGVPEPGTCGMLALGCMVMGWKSRRRRQAA